MLMWLSQRRPRQPHPALRLLLALPIVALLYSSTSAASSAASSGEAENPILTAVPLAVLNTSVIQESPLRIVLAGPTGAGKKLFCEFLRLSLRGSDMADPAQASAEFLRSYHLRRGQPASYLSDTQNVTKYTETLRGGGSVEIYDTPGLLSTDGPARDIEHLAEIGKHLESLDYVDAVLLVFSGHDSSGDRMKKVLAQLITVFQPAVYPNIALLFSHLDINQITRDQVIEPYLRGQFGFTSEEVKSRRFFVRNPLHAMAAKFDPNAEGETIASVLQRGNNNYLRKRYDKGVQELSRLLQYFATNVSRCTNLNFGTVSLRKLLEAAVQVSSSLRSELEEEKKNRDNLESQVTELQAEVSRQEEQKKNRAGLERHVTDLPVKVRQEEQERENRRQIVYIQRQVEEEKKNRAEAMRQVMNLRAELKLREEVPDAQASKEDPGNSASAPETNIFTVLAVVSTVLILSSSSIL